MNLLLITDNNPVDCSSGKQRAEILAGIYERLGVNTRIAGCSTIFDLDTALNADDVDLVFANIYSLRDERGGSVNLHQALERKRIPYIGSRSDVMDLVLHKSALKLRWKQMGVRTPGYVPVQERVDLEIGNNPPIYQLDHYPYLVKPDAEGNSRGIDQSAIADTYPRLKQLIRNRLPTYKSLLVEEFLGDREGLREFTVVLVGNGQNACYLPGEISIIVPQTRRMISTIDKDTHRTRIAQVPEDIKPVLIEFSRSAFRSAGMTDYGRLDVLKTRSEFFAIEINGQPMLPDRWFDGCASFGGLNRDQYCAVVLSQSVERWNQAGMELPALPHRVVELAGNGA